jgi:hemolysin III
MKKQKKKLNLKEEIANAISHGLMIPISIFIFLIYCNLLIKKNIFDIKNIVPLLIFNLSMIFLYMISFLYHFFSFTKIKKELQKLDHIGIYLLIWGSFIPFLFLNYKTHYKKIFFILQTIVVFLGILFKLFFIHKGKKIHLLLYNLLGWSGLIILKDLLQINFKIIFFLLIGGFLYSLGVFFYKKSYKKYYHLIWHIFVIIGNLFHSFAVYILLEHLSI